MEVAPQGLTSGLAAGVQLGLPVEPAFDEPSQSGGGGSGTTLASSGTTLASSGTAQDSSGTAQDSSGTAQDSSGTLSPTGSGTAGEGVTGTSGETTETAGPPPGVCGEGVGHAAQRLGGDRREPRGPLSLVVWPDLRALSSGAQPRRLRRCARARSCRPTARPAPSADASPGPASPCHRARSASRGTDSRRCAPPRSSRPCSPCACT